MHRYGYKIAHIVATATIWLWAMALGGVWWRMGGGGMPALWTLVAAALGAFALGVAAPVQFFRLAGWAAKALAHRQWLAVPALEGVAPDIPQWISRLLGASLLMAAAGGVISAGAVIAAVGAAGRLAGAFLLPGALWRLVHWALLTVALLAWGVGAALVHRTVSLGTAPAAEGEDEPWRWTHVDWVWGLALAAAVAALAYRTAADPLVVALAAGGVQIAAGLILVRTRFDVRLVEAPGPASVTRPSAGLCAGVLVGAAAMTVIACAQVRTLGDLWGVSPAGQCLVLAVSAAISGALHRRWGARRFVRPDRIFAGGAVLVAAAVTAQLALALTAVAAAPAGRWLAAAALLGQPPLAAGAVLGLLAHRKRFDRAGGTARQWMQWMLAGLAAGCLASAAGPGVLGATTAILVLLGCLAAAVVTGIGGCRGTDRQVAWAFAGGVLLLALTAALTAAATDLRRQGGPHVRAGAWLTAYEQSGLVGYLPRPSRPADPQLDRRFVDMLRTVLGRAEGDDDPARDAVVPGPRWLLVVRRPMVEPAAPPLVATTAVADPAMLALPAWRGRPAGDLFTTVAAGPFRYHGILHAPMRADHPAAGVVFNRRMLADLQERLAPGGVLAVHAWAVGDDIGPILAVARAARENAGPLLVAVRLTDWGAEMLILARQDGRPWTAESTALLCTGLGDDVAILPDSGLSALWVDVPAWNHSLTPPAPKGTATLSRLRTLLQAAGSPAR
ncbi:MAG: hypothetical protein GX591_03500 [Planctomycetes bacterium]|nr:hypothetical protein [Planctomycetota bacterium]